MALAPAGWAAGDDAQAAAAAAAANAAERQHAWVQAACAVQLDGAGNVLTGIPQLLAAAVERMVETAAIEDAMHPRPLQPTRLHGCRPPGISLEAYAARLLRYCKCSPVCFVAAFAYMARLHRGHRGARGGPLRVDAFTSHRLMAVGLVVATKFFDDKYYANSHYAQVAGVSLRELNVMELDLLDRLDYRARVDSAELAEALTTMDALAAGHTHSLPLGGPVITQPYQPVSIAAACRPALARTSPVAIAAARSASLGSEEGSSLTAAARLAVAAPCELSDEDEELRACAASAAAAPSAAAAQPLPWVAAAPAYAAAAAAEAACQRSQPPRPSKKRCSMEAGQVPAGHAVHALLVAREGEAA